MTTKSKVLLLNSAAILGLRACDKLGLAKRVYTVESTNTTQPTSNTGNSSVKNIVDSYMHVFEGLGCLPGEQKLTVDETVTPVASACR